MSHRETIWRAIQRIAHYFGSHHSNPSAITKAVGAFDDTRKTIKSNERTPDIAKATSVPTPDVEIMTHCTRRQLTMPFNKSNLAFNA